MIYTFSHLDTTRILIEDMAIPDQLPKALQHAGCARVAGVWIFPTDKMPLIRAILGLAYSHSHGNPLWENATDELRSIRAKILTRLAAYDCLLGDNEPCETVDVSQRKDYEKQTIRDQFARALYDHYCGLNVEFLEAHTTRELAALAARVLPREDTND